MEARRGCEFEWEDENFETTTYYITFVQGIEDVFTGSFSGTIYAQPTDEIPPQTPISWETDDEEFPFFEYAKILGRPIRLADVLLAEMNKNGDYRDTFAFEQITQLWNLKDDNLDHQSDKTKQFLIDLLVR